MSSPARGDVRPSGSQGRLMASLQLLLLGAKDAFQLHHASRTSVTVRNETVKTSETNEAFFCSTGFASTWIVEKTSKSRHYPKSVTFRHVFPF